MKYLLIAAHFVAIVVLGVIVLRSGQWALDWLFEFSIRSFFAAILMTVVGGMFAIFLWEMIDSVRSLISPSPSEQHQTQDKPL